MTLNAIIVFASISTLLWVLYKDWIQPALAFLLVILLYFFVGIISIQDILIGLANENVILIFVLVVLSDIVKRTNGLDRLINSVLKPGLTYKAYLFRMTGLVSAISGFVNNTPLVAFMIPYVNQWSRKNNISPSRLLIPLSFAAILGGIITLIGTSTNLVVNGLAMEAGLPSLGFFELTKIGVPVAIMGLIYMYFFAPKILPDNKDLLSDFQDIAREYLVETIVPAKSKLVGKSIEKAELRNLKGLFLAEIFRGTDVFAPVSPKEIIHENDRLFFAGDTQTILELVENNKDLELAYGNTMIFEKENNIIEVITTNNSRLINKTAREANFRKKYDAAIIAIQRNGEKISGKIGEIVLKSGDLLLLVAGKNFNNYTENEQDFIITSKIKELKSIPQWKKIIFFSAILIAFALSFAKVVSLLVGLLGVLAITAIIDMVKFSELRRSVDLNMLFILVLALAMGKAITNSGVAEMATHFVIKTFHGNLYGILLSLFIITLILTQFVTNVAAVAITFPVAISTAISMGTHDYSLFVMTIAIAASGAFLTPIGYQTNLMVFGPGGYKFKDFIRFGMPLIIVYAIISIGILVFLYNT